MSKNRVLLTGAYGYIGHNLQMFLRSKEYEVICIDRKLGNEVLDISSETLKEISISHIIHLAAVSGIKNCAEDLEQSYIDNVLSVSHLMEEAGKAGINVTFASSQAAKTPHANYYALNKYYGEVAAKRASLLYPINVNVLRFTNVYGGSLFLEKKNTVVCRFAKAKMNDEDIVVNGDGSQERDFIHVYDVCNAIWRSTLFQCPTPVDIGTGVATSVRQLAEHFEHRFTFDQESDTIGTMRNVADPEDAHQHLGFVAEIKLEDQIRKEFF